METATEQYVYCSPLCKSQRLDLQVMRFIRSYGGQHNNILEFDILWLSGAVPCPLCMLVNIKQFE